MVTCAPEMKPSPSAKHQPDVGVSLLQFASNQRKAPRSRFDSRIPPSDFGASLELALRTLEQAFFQAALPAPISNRHPAVGHFLDSPLPLAFLLHVLLPVDQLTPPASVHKFAFPAYHARIYGIIIEGPQPCKMHPIDGYGGPRRC